MGRIVVTHSTYIEGLIEKLKIIANQKGIKTITPGRIRKTKGRTEELTLRISTKTISGYKLIARKGYSVQEVFIVTDIDISTICQMIS